MTEIAVKRKKVHKSIENSYDVTEEAAAKFMKITKHRIWQGNKENDTQREKGISYDLNFIYYYRY